MYPYLESDYRCFTCELARGGCICEHCFNDHKHLNHEFKIITSGSCYCDCGNDECLRREYFCKDHLWQGERAEAPLMGKKEGELFNK
jgi:hypothetical protein